MPRQGVSGAWPMIGERRHKATLQRAATSYDDGRGRTQTWASYASWFVKVTTVPFAVSDVQATSQFQLEGLFRSDIAVGDRVLIKGYKLKVILLENPLFLDRTLVAYCSQWSATNQ